MNKIRRMGACAFALVMSLCLAVGASATGSSGDMSAIEDGMVSGLTAASSSIMGVLGSILPIALGILAAVLVITIGIRVFRRVTGR